jgi:hypothetical protein
MGGDLLIDKTNLNMNSAYSTALQQQTQGMNNLFSALKSGDIAKAQEAYAASGLPAMNASNTSPLGRLYNGLRNGDLKSAQQAALAMQGHKAGKDTSTTTSNSNSLLNNADPKAQLKAAAIELAKQSKAQNGLSTLLGLGNNINTWG